MSLLSEKVAIVTGASGGIGGAISLRFMEEGASVVCVDIAARRTESLAEPAGGGDRQSVMLVADVAEEKTAEDAVALALDRFGRVDILVSNAVHDLTLGPVTQISHEDWRRSMAVNLDSSFLLAKHVIPAMERSGGGSIILVASELARVAKPGRAWYCAQKAALVSMARAMALDHAHQNIRVNSLSPGPIETDRYVRKFDTLEAARASNETLLNRLGSVGEIACGAVFLASDQSSFMTGADLLMDGGRTAV